MSIRLLDVWGCVMHTTPMTEREQRREICSAGQRFATRHGLAPSCVQGWVPGWHVQDDPALTYRQE